MIRVEPCLFTHSQLRQSGWCKPSFHVCEGRLHSEIPFHTLDIQSISLNIEECVLACSPSLGAGMHAADTCNPYDPQGSLFAQVDCTWELPILGPQ